MKLRIFRLFICFLLVCCLIVRISPIQAKAATLTGTVAAGTAIAAGLVALGIGVGATETTFNNLVDSLTAVAGSDRVPVWISETADGFVTYLQGSFLGSLLAHCFDTGVLSESQNLPSVPSYLSESLSEAASSPYAALIYQPGTSSPYRVVKSDYPFYINTNPGVGGMHALSVEGSRNKLYYRSADYQTWQSANGTTFDPSIAVITYFGSASESISTSQDLTLGSVGATMSAPNYDPWRSNAIPVVPPVVGGGTADEEDALPVTFPGLDTPSITGQTQAGAQTGATPGTVVDEIVNSGAGTDTETGTISGVISEIKSLPVSISQAIADVFMPSQTIEAYSLDLKSLFPFCIPFDIYAMLSALAAEPVAPKFDFELDFGPVGVIPISADFSEWDNVAQLLRTCEAALFAVGLAVKTKDLIGW